MDNSNVLNRYQKIRSETERICTPLLKEDYVVQPITDVSPPKWHLGHTSWFFELFLLEKYIKNYKLFHSHYNYIFNSYYESAGERIFRANRGNLSRPDIDDVYKYRQHVDKAMSEWLDGGQLDEHARELLEIGLNHEQQHQELLLTDIKYILGHNPLFPSYSKLPSSHNIKKSKNEKFVEVPGGIYAIGNDEQKFTYDNENPQHKVYLEPFQIMNRLVTNLEYLEFIEDKGYQRHELWLSDGWEWIKKNQIEAPLYWHNINGTWHYYTPYGLKPLDLYAPLSHVSYYEADAYAHWKGKRLPNEAEWEAAFDKLHCHRAQYNLYDGQVNNPKAAENGSTQIFGDVWEWTASAYLPYPGYHKPDGAIGEYNGKFMVDQMVLRGGSCATPVSHIRKTYRNFFQTSKRWQFTGIRLANHL